MPTSTVCTTNNNIVRYTYRCIKLWPHWFLYIQTNKHATVHHGLYEVSTISAVVLCVEFRAKHFQFEWLWIVVFVWFVSSYLLFWIFFATNEYKNIDWHLDILKKHWFFLCLAFFIDSFNFLCATQKSIYHSQVVQFFQVIAGSKDMFL